MKNSMDAIFRRAGDAVKTVSTLYESRPNSAIILSNCKMDCSRAKQKTADLLPVRDPAVFLYEKDKLLN